LGDGHLKLDFDFGKPIQITNMMQGKVYEDLKNEILFLMIRQKDNEFEQERTPDGEAWQSLSKKSEALRNKKIKDKKKKGNIKILQDTGTLKNSLAKKDSPPEQIRSTTGDEIILGTNVRYAKIQNDGGLVVVPSFEVENGFGKGIEFTVPERIFEIPARPFIGFGSEDEDAISKQIMHHLSKGGFE